MSKEKKPFALLMNDIHVSSDNIEEFNTNWFSAIELCEKLNISELIIGGDLWQSRAAQSLNVLMAVHNAVMIAISKNIHLTIAEGNHCKVDQESVLGYSHIFSGYKNVDVVDVYNVIEFGERGSLFVMSYFPENGSFQEKLKDIVDNELYTDDYNILYCHEGINGALATPADKELPTGIFKAFDKVLVGHYHDRIKIKGTNIEYIGASRQHNFGEDEDKGYTILYDDGSTEFVKNKTNTRFMTIEVDYNVIKNAKKYAELLENIHETSEEGRYKQRIRIKCETNEVGNINKREILDAGANKVEICTLKTEAETLASSHSFEQKFDKQGIKDEYASFCESKGIFDVETGLYYLEQI